MPPSDDFGLGEFLGKEIVHPRELGTGQLRNGIIVVLAKSQGRQKFKMSPTKKGEDMDRKILWICIISTSFLTLSFGYSDGAENEIGFFFDQLGTVNCLPDSVNGGFAQNAYLILRNCSSLDGVAGWEGAFSFSPSIYFTNTDYIYDAINIGVFPEYIVGMSAPIPWSESILLATFSLFVVGPGEVFFHAVENASITGIMGPTLLTGGEAGYLVPMNYSFGSPFNAIATIGLQECPQDSLFQEPVGQGELPLVEGSSSSSLTREIHIDSAVANKTNDPNWSDLWLGTDVGLLGKVNEIESGCYSDGQSDYGVIKISLETKELYWGPQLDNYEIWIEGVDIPNCMSYGPNMKFTMASSINIDDELIIFARQREGVFWSNKWRVFPGNVESEFGLKALQLSDLKLVALEKTMKNQISYSDAVLVLEYEESNEPEPPAYFFRVIETFVGRDSIESEIIKVNFPYGFSQFVGEDNVDKRFVCFLTNLDSGVFYLSDGYKSIFFQEENGFFTISGLPVDIQGMLD